jgi:hypothetical protein
MVVAERTNDWYFAVKRCRPRTRDSVCKKETNPTHAIEKGRRMKLLITAPTPEALVLVVGESEGVRGAAEGGESGTQFTGYGKNRDLQAHFVCHQKPTRLVRRGRRVVGWKAV